MAFVSGWPFVEITDYAVFWAGVQGLALLGTAWVAWYQLTSLRSDERDWKTLEACEKYDSDPVLYNVIMKLRDARDSGMLGKNPRPFRAEVVLLLNYFEGIATAADQGFYNEKIVRDHLEAIVYDHVDEFLGAEMVKRMEMTADFGSLKRLVAKWKTPPAFYRFRR